MSHINWSHHVAHQAEPGTGEAAVPRPLTCDNFLYEELSRARPSGAPGGPPRPGSEHGRGSPRERASGRAGGPPPGAGVEGALGAGRRQPGPLPLARQRTGAGRCRHAASPAPARQAVPAVTHPQWPRLQELAGRSSRARHPVAAKAPSQGRAHGRVPPLRSGQTPDSELPRQDRHLSEGRGKPRLSTLNHQWISKAYSARIRDGPNKDRPHRCNEVWPATPAPTGIG